MSSSTYLSDELRQQGWRVAFNAQNAPYWWNKETGVTTLSPPSSQSPPPPPPPGQPSQRQRAAAAERAARGGAAAGASATMPGRQSAPPPAVGGGVHGVRVAAQAAAQSARARAAAVNSTHDVSRATRKYAEAEYQELCKKVGGGDPTAMEIQRLQELKVRLTSRALVRAPHPLLPRPRLTR